jgi:multiple sugar transport system permease protein
MGVLHASTAVLLSAICLLCAFPIDAAEKAPTVELHVWGLNMGTPRTGWMAIVSEFERQYPGVKIVLGPADRGSDLQKLLCGVVGNSPPDVFKREANLLGDIAARGILMPLDALIEEDRHRADGVHEEDYSPGVWQSGRGPDGKMYAVAEGTNDLFLVYNKDVFREAGLDPERPPANWEEWKGYTRKLTLWDEKGRIVRLGTMIHAPYKEDDLLFYVAQLGGDVLSKDGRECLLDGPDALEALRFIREIVECAGGRRAYDEFSQVQEGLSSWPLGTGRVAMSVEGPSVIYEAMRRNMSVDLGIVPVPSPSGRKPITTSARHGVYLIPYNARRPKEAWDFIRFANGPEGRLVFTQALADEQARNADKHAQQLDERAQEFRARGNIEKADQCVAETQRERAFKGQMYAGFQANLKAQELLGTRFTPKDPLLARAYAQCEALVRQVEFVPVPDTPVYGVLSDECRRAVERAQYGEMSPEKALADADRRVQEEIDLFYGRDNLPRLQWRYVWAACGALFILAAAFYVWHTRGERAATSLQHAENRSGLLFVAPWAFGFIVFVAGPMVFSLAMSFCSYDVIHPARFVGIGNYSFLLFKDPLFWKSLGNTVFMVVALPIGMVFSLGIALLLNAQARGMSAYRTVFYLPAITPVVATAVLWYALLNPDGLVNTGLRAAGIDPPSWLGDKNWSKPAIVLMGLWGAGGGMIIWLAGLQGIPSQLYEAASIDGAGAVRRFFSITLPMLTPYIFFSFVTGIIGVFQIFAQALILTRGGPADSTLFYVYYLFNNAFRYFKMGYASAQAWILFVIVLVLTLLQLRLSKRWVHYE